jgi:hypothetical protein
MKLIFKAKAIGGALKITNRERLVKVLNNLEGKDLVLTLEKQTTKRSDEQNGYYWSVVVPMVKDGLIDLGFDRDELDKDTVHDYLKDRFLKKDLVNEDTGEVITIVQSSKKIDTVQFNEYVADIQRWAAEFLGIEIPDPDPTKSTKTNLSR